MDIHAEKVLHFKKVLEILIRRLSGEDIHTPHSTVGIADLKVSFIEFQRGRTDKSFVSIPALSISPQSKMNGAFL